MRLLSGKPTPEQSAAANRGVEAALTALTGITDATISNWSCSVHEAFDKWPVDFQVLAIARDIGSSSTAPDGSVGTPYILARGVTVISDIKLTPEVAENPAGASHTVTAKVTSSTPSPGTPVVATTVAFTVISGPNAGDTGTGTVREPPALPIPATARRVRISSPLNS